jgi:hypothetical protein
MTKQWRLLKTRVPAEVAAASTFLDMTAVNLDHGKRQEKWVAESQ